MHHYTGTGVLGVRVSVGAEARWLFSRRSLERSSSKGRSDRARQDARLLVSRAARGRTLQEAMSSARRFRQRRRRTHRPCCRPDGRAYPCRR